MDPTTPLPRDDGRRLAGRYAVRGAVGQGGMAEVFLAHDEVLDRDVAVKVLAGQYADDPGFLDRFRREAQSAAKLNHSNVVNVYDFGADGDRPFIVMEYVGGGSLRDLTRREVPAAREVIRLVAQAARGLHYAHTQGLVHRDVKPANLLLTDSGDVKVADFGIARAVGPSSVTQTATVFGTAAYVAPEQAQGHPVDARTDVYALGVVLYELLTGEQPFRADTPVALAYQHVQTPPRPPRELDPTVSADLESVVLRALAKEPDQRYPSARAFAEDLERVAHGEPVQAGTATVALPPTAPRRAERQTDRTLVASPVPTSRPPQRGSRPPGDRPPGDRGADDRSGPGAGRWVLIGLALLAVFAVIGAALAGAFDGGGAAQVTVPDLRDRTLPEAEAALEERGLRAELGEEVADPEIAEGRVVETDPAADEQVEEATTVLVTLSSGPGEVQVPGDLEGLTFAEASAELEQAGLVAARGETRNSGDVEEGTVIETAPGAGSQVDRGSTVEVVLSAGPGTVEVPAVVGESAERARQLLGDVGLAVQVDEEESAEVAAGQVIEANPATGTPVEVGTTVTLTVSSGPPPLQVPDVEGDTLSSAKQELETFCDLEPPCLVVGEERVFDDAAPGTVLAQDPAAGSEVRRGARVQLTTSRGPQPEPEPTATPDVEEPPTEEESEVGDG